MYTAIIIDDEEIIRNGLINNYNWDKDNIEIVGSAPDGDEGFELICAKEPDIVLTDIKMPTLNGIEMIKLLHNANLFPYIIFISGYNDFEYTRQAIKLGASDYILKPFNPADLEETLKDCIKKIKNDRKQLLLKEHTEAEKIMTHIFIDTEPVFHKIQLSNLSDCRIVDNNEYFVLSILAINNLDKFDEIISEDINYFSYVDSYIKDSLINKKIVINIPEKRQIVFFQVGNDKDFLLKQIAEEAKTITTKLYSNLGLDAVIGISTAHKEIYELEFSYHEAIKSLRYYIFDNNSSIISYEKLPNISLHFNKGIFDKKLINHIKLKDTETSLHLLEEAFKYFVYNKDDIPPSELKLYCIKICNRLETFFENTDISSINQPKEDFPNKIINTKSVRDLYNIMKHLVIKNIEHLSFHNNINASIQKSLEYIQKNYSKPITLREVSNSVYLSESRFSTLFCKTTGQPFSKYLAQYRIDMAKDILRKNRYMKIYEVCEAVGYTDSRYFSTLFKKLEGVTPSQFVKALFK
ncbi:response regulator [Clostridium sediminicola]|uniref:response regulator n=1 Tax=Clostridium sediminicola TaxID=3114879 RepID=UPI0031F1E9BF